MPIRIAETACVCEDADLIGDISIGENTVVHPKCRIYAKGGPIVIGDGNVLEENVLIENSIENNPKEKEHPVLTIGSNNLIQVGCSIRSKFIGDGNIFEVQSQMETSSIIGNGCIIGPTVIINSESVVEDSSIIVKGQQGKYIRRKQSDHMKQSHLSLMSHYTETLRTTKSRWYMGNFHHLKKNST